MSTTASPFVTYGCPDWCTRTDHHADVVDADNPPVHYGPDFGVFETRSEGDGEREVQIFEALVFAGPLAAARLRKLAADALTAAEWLEARA